MICAIHDLRSRVLCLTIILTAALCSRGAKAEQHSGARNASIRPTYNDYLFPLVERPEALQPSPPMPAIEIPEGQPPIVAREARRVQQLIADAAKDPKMQRLMQKLPSLRFQLKGGVPSRSYISKPGDGIRLNPFAIKSQSDLAQFIAHEGAHNQLAMLSPESSESLKRDVLDILISESLPQFYPTQKSVFLDEIKEPHAALLGIMERSKFQKARSLLESAAEKLATQRAREAVREHAVVNAMEYAYLVNYFGDAPQAEKRMREDRHYPEISAAVVNKFDRIAPVLNRYGLLDSAQKSAPPPERSADL